MEKLESIVLQFIENAYPNSQHVEIRTIEAGSINLNTMVTILKVTVVGDFGNKGLKKIVKVWGEVRITNLEIPGARGHND